MMADESGALLTRALQLSQELLRVAEGGDPQAVLELDAERLRLLHSMGSQPTPVGADERSLLKEIAELNHRAIGFLEHRRRGKAREIDTAAVGRRAVAAYSTTRLQR
jgi:hypothetical protein